MSTVGRRGHLVAGSQARARGRTSRGIVSLWPIPQVPRLKDVAKAANVSLAAASRILRGDRERFGEETCRRVIEASRNLAGGAICSSTACRPAARKPSA